jgi:hypothetical protein
MVVARVAPTTLQEEFDRQVETLLHNGYPRVAGISAQELIRYVEPLKERLEHLSGPGAEPSVGRVPFVIVVKKELVPADQAMPLIELAGQAGFTTVAADELARFKPITSVRVPSGAAYLLLDVATGKDTLNLTPDEAMTRITAAGRSPLTLDEGIALVTHYPGILKSGNCFSMLGSRCGDRRVTALWISGGRPRLGWCWAGNPHTWLGSASCGGRVGP